MWIAAAPAFALPSIDAAARTGVRAEGDAAVVVGIEDYFVLPDVPYAERDAAAFYDFSVYTRGIPLERVARLVGPVNREQVLGAVETAGQQAGPDGTVFVYFAGHGAASPTSGERLLLGADAQPDLASFDARAIPVAELERLATAGGASAVLVLDACYSGRTRSGDELLAGKRFAVPVAAASAGVTEWTAAGPGQWSGPLEPVQHGAFTYLAVGALRGWADGELSGERDGTVTLAEASRFVSRSLAELEVRDQEPTYSGDPDLALSVGREAAPGWGDAPDPVQAVPAVAAPTPPAEAPPVLRWATADSPRGFALLEVGTGEAFSHAARISADGGGAAELIEPWGGASASLAGFYRLGSAADVGLRAGVVESYTRSSVGDWDLALAEAAWDSVVEEALASSRLHLPGFERVYARVEAGALRLPAVPDFGARWITQDTQHELEVPGAPARVLPVFRIGLGFDPIWARPSGFAPSCELEVAAGPAALFSSPVRGECLIGLTLGPTGSK